MDPDQRAAYLITLLAQMRNNQPSSGCWAAFASGFVVGLISALLCLAGVALSFALVIRA